jgi:hypothetical protein
MNDNYVFMIDKDKSKQFLEDSKKNVISSEFLEKCLRSARLLNRNRKMSGMTEEDFREMNEVRLNRIAQQNTFLEFIENLLDMIPNLDEEIRQKIYNLHGLTNE